MADYAKEKNDVLAALCKERSLPHTGKKADIVNRLEDFDVNPLTVPNQQHLQTSSITTSTTTAMASTRTPDGINRALQDELREVSAAKNVLQNEVKKLRLESARRDDQLEALNKRMNNLEVDHIKLNRDLHAAPKAVPSPKDFAAAVAAEPKVPTVENIVAAVKISTANDFAAVLKGSTVEEIAAVVMKEVTGMKISSLEDALIIVREITNVKSAVSALRAMLEDGGAVHDMLKQACADSGSAATGVRRPEDPMKVQRNVEDSEPFFQSTPDRSLTPSTFSRGVAPIRGRTEGRSAPVLGGSPIDGRSMTPSPRPTTGGFEGNSSPILFGPPNDNPPILFGPPNDKPPILFGPPNDVPPISFRPNTGRNPFPPPTTGRPTNQFPPRSTTSRFTRPYFRPRTTSVSSIETPDKLSLTNEGEIVSLGSGEGSFVSMVSGMQFTR